MEYTNVFPKTLRVLVGLLTLSLLTAIAITGPILGGKPSVQVDAWLRSAQDVIQVTAAPYIALMAAYVWLYPKVSGWPQWYKSLTWTPFPFCGMVLLTGQIILSVAQPAGCVSWAAMGAVFGLSAPWFLLSGILIVVRGWEAHRNQ